jgi:hypothetical protein
MINQEQLTAIQNAFVDLGDKNLKSVVCAVLTEDGDIETLFAGSGADQTFLMTLTTAHIHRALVESSLVEKKR